MAKFEFSVPDMHCNNCVKRVSDSLDKAGVKYEVSLEAHTVTIDGCEGCAKKAEEAIKNAGFSAERK